MGDTASERRLVDAEPPLRALFVEAQRGNQEKYREFLETIQPRLRRYLCRVLPSESLAADCLQEVLLSIHRMRHTYDKDRSLLAWVHAIARNKVIDFYRAGARRADGVFSNTDVVEQESDNASAASQFEARNFLAHVLKGIPEEFQKPLLLTKLEGYTVSEAAKELGISESLVKVRVHRAIGKLQRILEDEGLTAL